VMVANVFFVIIPGQRELVHALSERRAPDPAPGRHALMRSRHNNYLTLPVLFIMISGHFPSTHGHRHGIWILLAIALIGIAVRHYFNIRHLRPRAIWILPAALAAAVVVMLLSAPSPVQRGSTMHVPDADAAIILRERCISCHADQPEQPGFSAPPAGLSFEDPAVVLANAGRIYISAVATASMPPGNLTGISETERAVLGIWLESKLEKSP
jgi:uncharacterized membrane protein